LEEVNLSDNNLTTIPVEYKQLKKCQKFDLLSNPIELIPDEFGHVPNNCKVLVNKNFLC
jgi:Leucine-rich repeat (LRR) protein